MTQYQIPSSLITQIEPDSLVIPPRPLRIVIDCSSAGNWRSPDGQTIYSVARNQGTADLGIMPVRIDYYAEYGVEVADLLFVPVWGDRVGDANESGKLPFGLLSVVKLKRNASGTGSLDTFEVWLTKYAPTGRHPATWVWISWFERKTGEDAEGKGIAWHRIHWLPKEIDNDRPYKMLIQLGKRKEGDPNFDTMPRSKAIEQVRAIAASPEATPDDLPTPEPIGQASLQPAKPPALPSAKPPALPSAPPAAQWFIPNREDPISVEELLKIANPDTQVWRQGLANWMPLSETELASQLF